MTERPAKRKLSPMSLLIIITLSGFFFGLFAGYFEDSRPGISSGVVGIFILVTLGVSLLYWRRLDETAREAHKFSWLWGSSVAILIVIAIASLITIKVGFFGPFPALLDAQLSPSVAYTYGIFSVLGLQIVAYGVVWVLWWLRMR